MTIQEENNKLKLALKKCLPAIESAYWDHWSAGCMPGAGYNHNVYHNLPFSWRQKKEFESWISEVKSLIGENPG